MKRIIGNTVLILPAVSPSDYRLHRRATEPVSKKILSAFLETEIVKVSLCC